MHHWNFIGQQVPYDQQAVPLAGTAVGPFIVQVVLAPVADVQLQLQVLVPVDVQAAFTVLPSQVHGF